MRSEALYANQSSENSDLNKSNDSVVWITDAELFNDEDADCEPSAKNGRSSSCSSSSSNGSTEIHTISSRNLVNS